jgi:hypothetical protein
MLKLLVGTKDVTTNNLKGTSLTPLVRPSGDRGSQWADSEIGEVRLAVLIVTSVTNPNSSLCDRLQRITAKSPIRQH